MEVVSPRFLGHFEPEALVVVSTMNFRKSAPEYLPDAEGKNSPEMLRIGLYVSGRQGWGGEIHYKKLKYAAGLGRGNTLQKIKIHSPPLSTSCCEIEYFCRNSSLQAVCV